MNFETYLRSTEQTAETEKGVLDELSGHLQTAHELSTIELRAARASLQILIENSIGKARRILKHYNCPLVPNRGRDAFTIMYDTGLLEDESYQALMQAVGFRNAMIHDYMNFDENVLLKIVEQQKYLEIYSFLREVPNYNEVQISRVTNFSF